MDRALLPGARAHPRVAHAAAALGGVYQFIVEPGGPLREPRASRLYGGVLGIVGHMLAGIGFGLASVVPHWRQVLVTSASSGDDKTVTAHRHGVGASRDALSSSTLGALLSSTLG